jgi:hypothetical protein
MLRALLTSVLLTSAGCFSPDCTRCRPALGAGVQLRQRDELLLVLNAEDGSASTIWVPTVVSMSSARVQPRLRRALLASEDLLELIGHARS